MALRYPNARDTGEKGTDSKHPVPKTDRSGKHGGSFRHLGMISAPQTLPLPVCMPLSIQTASGAFQCLDFCIFNPILTIWYCPTHWHPVCSQTKKKGWKIYQQPPFKSPTVCDHQSVLGAWVLITGRKDARDCKSESKAFDSGQDTLISVHLPKKKKKKILFPHRKSSSVFALGGNYQPITQHKL